MEKLWDAVTTRLLQPTTRQDMPKLSRYVMRVKILKHFNLMIEKFILRANLVRCAWVQSIGHDHQKFILVVHVRTLPK